MNKQQWKGDSMLFCMILFSLIIYIVGMLIVNDKQAWTTGLLFGLIFAILKYKLMEKTIKRSLQMPEAKAQRYASVQYMIRYLLTGVVLVIAALEPSIDLLGVFLGLFSMKAAAYMQLAVKK